MPGIAIAHGFEYQGKSRNQLGGLRDCLLVGRELGNLAPMGALHMGLLMVGKLKLDGECSCRRMRRSAGALVRRRRSRLTEEPGL